MKLLVLSGLFFVNDTCSFPKDLRKLLPILIEHFEQLDPSILIEHFEQLDPCVTKI